MKITTGCFLPPKLAKANRKWEELQRKLQEEAQKNKEKKKGKNIKHHEKHSTLTRTPKEKDV